MTETVGVQTGLNWNGWIVGEMMRRLNHQLGAGGPYFKLGPVRAADPHVDSSAVTARPGFADCFGKSINRAAGLNSPPCYGFPPAG
jgi:hypothetical protein